LHLADASKTRVDRSRQQLKISTFACVFAFKTFFFYEFSKSRDKALRNIYNSQFNDNSENQWVVF